MNQQVVRALLVEIDGSTEKLRRALGEGGVELEKFGTKAKQTGATAAAGASAGGSRQAEAARQIAMATETMARQGKVSGETAKQVIAQGANIAMAFGPTGAIVGAIGIATLAIVTMFTRVRDEARKAAEESAKEFLKISRMDLQTSSRRLAEVNSGDFDVNQALAGQGNGMSREEALAIFQGDRTIVGLKGLAAERARIEQEQAQLTARIGARPRVDGGVRAGERDDRQLVMRTADERKDDARRAEIVRELAAIADAVKELEKVRPAIERRVARSSAEEVSRTGVSIAESTRDDATKEAEKIAEKARQEAKALKTSLTQSAARDASEVNTAYRRALVDGFTGTREEIIASFSRLAEEAERSGDKGTIPVLEAARVDALALLDLLEQNERVLRSIEDADLNDRIAKTAERDRSGPLEAEIAALESQREAANARVIELQQRLAVAAAKGDTVLAVRLERDRKVALGEVVRTQSAVEGLVARENKERARGVSLVREQAKQVAQTIDGVLQMAAAWGNVDRGVVDVLRSVTSLAIAVPDLLRDLETLKAAREGSAVDEKGNPVSVVQAGIAVASGGIQALGALSTIATTLFGTSPEAQENKRVQRENTRALDRLTKEIGGTGINLTGSQFRDAGQEATKLLGGDQLLKAMDLYLIEKRARAKRAGEIVPLVTSERIGLDELPDGAKIDWKQFSDVDRDALEKAAQELGVTLNGTVGSFRALQEAIAIAEGKLFEFGDSYEDQRTIDNAKLTVQGITDPIERLVQGTKAAQTVSPAIAKLFENRNLADAADREALRADLLKLLETMEAGGDVLDPDLGGGLTRDELLAAILQISSGLDDISGATQSQGSTLGGVSGFRGLTEAAGERLADYQRALVQQGETAISQRASMTTALQAQLLTLQKLSLSPLTVPPLVGYGPPVTREPKGIVIAAGAINLNVDLSGMTITVPAGSDGRAIGDAVARATGGEIERVLYDVLSRALKARGDVSIVRGPR